MFIRYSIVPNRRRLRLLISSLLEQLHALAGRKGKRGVIGLGRGLKVGQLTLSMGPARAEVCRYVQRVIIASKRVI
jgi:hypothetical protein